MRLTGNLSTAVTTKIYLDVEKKFVAVLLLLQNHVCFLNTISPYFIADFLSRLL